MSTKTVHYEVTASDDDVGNVLAKLVTGGGDDYGDWVNRGSYWQPHKGLKLYADKPGFTDCDNYRPACMICLVPVEPCGGVVGYSSTYPGYDPDDCDQVATYTTNYPGLTPPGGGGPFGTNATFTAFTDASTFLNSADVPAGCVWKSPQYTFTIAGTSYTGQGLLYVAATKHLVMKVFYRLTAGGASTLLETWEAGNATGLVGAKSLTNTFGASGSFTATSNNSTELIGLNASFTRLTDTADFVCPAEVPDLAENCVYATEEYSFTVSTVAYVGQAMLYMTSPNHLILKLYYHSVSGGTGACALAETWEAANDTGITGTITLTKSGSGTTMTVTSDP